MNRNKEGQIVKFHSPMPDEDPEQLFVIIEMKDGDRARADINALQLCSGIPLFSNFINVYN